MGYFLGMLGFGILLVGGCMYGLAYLRAKSEGISVTTALKDMLLFWMK